MDVMRNSNVAVAERMEDVEAEMPTGYAQEVESLPTEERQEEQVETTETVVIEQKEILDRKEQLRSKRGYWILRRGQDIFFSLLALIVLSPLLALIAIVVFLDDPKGSPIFSQIRCGRDGKEFKFYKFRSMCVDADRL